MRLIAGFGTPTAGRILIGERDVTRLPPWSRNVGMVFQSYALWPHMSVRKNVAFGLERRKFNRAEIERKVADALELVGLSDFAERRPAQLSGGQQQRVALARTIVIEPEVLLLDEPLSNLDARLRVEMRVELRQLQRKLGITAIYVTHDQEDANSIADNIAVLDQGRIQQIGTPIELYDRPANRFVATFLGTANLIEGAIEAERPLRRRRDCASECRGRGGAGLHLDPPAGYFRRTARQRHCRPHRGARVPRQHHALPHAGRHAVDRGRCAAPPRFGGARRRRDDRPDHSAVAGFGVAVARSRVPDARSASRDPAIFAKRSIALREVSALGRGSRSARCARFTCPGHDMINWSGSRHEPPMSGSFFVYILASKRNGTLYVGVTNDLARRMSEHKAKLVPGFTRQYGVDKLVYFEEYGSILEARARERTLKRWLRIWKLELIEKMNPEWRDLTDELAF